MQGVVERNKQNRLTGTTPIKYRVVIEFDPPRLGRRKNPETGSREIHRIEAFISDEHTFYWLVNAVSRDAPRTGQPERVNGQVVRAAQTDIARAEAVLLATGEVVGSVGEDHVVRWQDANPKELE